MNANHIGALFMVASMASFTLNDTFIKLTGGAVPLFQLLFLRGLLTTFFVIALARWLNALQFNLARRDWGLIGVRSLSEVSLVVSRNNRLASDERDCDRLHWHVADRAAHR